MNQPLETLFKSTQAAARKAIQQAGPDPWLVAYDVNGIQSLIAANSRPIAMRGASQWLKQFDQQQRQRAGVIFAGGGRGMVLTSSKALAQALQQELERTFFDQSFGGVLATALAPYATRDARQSLELLRARLELAKEGARAPGGKLPTSRADACADCHAFQGTQSSPRPGAHGEIICDRCAAFIRLGGTSAQQGSLIDLSSDEQVAVISADGNNLGQIFSSLSSLEACAAFSALIGEVFARAQETAASAIGHALISVASGGDDVRAFLAPRDCLTYVTLLTQKIEEGLTDAAGILTPLLRASGSDEPGEKQALEKQALKRAGLGVGLLIASGAFPASRLLTLAHQLEDLAKQGCRMANWRSGLEVALMTAGELRIELQAFDIERTGHPFSLETEPWQKTLRSAQALTKVESSQRGWLADIQRLEESAEAQNLFRYQVARSHAWQNYFKTVEAAWTSKDGVIAAMPAPGLLTLARLMEKTS